MKQFRYIFFLSALVIFSLESCKTNSCPAYDSVNKNKSYSNESDNAAKEQKKNKQDIEAKRKAALKGPPVKKRRRAYSLYPKWMKIKSK